MTIHTVDHPDSRTHRLARPSGHVYTRGSVERALTHHFGQGSATGWSSNGKGGYLVACSKVGVVELRTLREAALFVIAAAEKASRVRRGTSPDN